MTARPRAKVRPATFLEFVGALGVQLYPAQRVAAAVAFDGVQPAELEGEDRELARQLFGPVDHVPPEARDVVAAICGGRAGKSYVLGALRLLHLGMTHPLDTLAPGEVAFGVIMAERLSLARQTLRYIIGAAGRSHAISQHIVTRGADALVLDRPDGKRIRFEVLPASRGGAAVRARSYFGAFLDEAAFFFADDGYTVTDGEIFRALSPRVLPGGQLVVASTPWLESGVLYDLFRANHGDPACAIDGDVSPGQSRTAVAIWAPTKLFNLEPKIHRAVDAEYARDPENAEREFGARYVLRGAGRYFDAVAIKRSAKERPATLAAVPMWPTIAALDPGFTSDAFAGVVVRVEHQLIRTVELFELRPKKGKPLKPSEAIGQFAAIAKRHGASELWTDIHYLETVREHAHAAGLGVSTPKGGANAKELVHAGARDALLADAVETSAAHQVLHDQLRSIVGKPKPGGGMQISAPRRAGRHGDIASAWVIAVWRAYRHVMRRRPRPGPADEARRQRRPQRETAGLHRAAKIASAPVSTEQITVRHVFGNGGRGAGGF